MHASTHASTSTQILFRLLPLQLAVIICASQPERGEKDETSARANCTRVIRPGCAEEARVAVVSWWHDGNGHRVIEERPPANDEVSVGCSQERRRFTHPFRR